MSILEQPDSPHRARRKKTAVAGGGGDIEHGGKIHLPAGGGGDCANLWGSGGKREPGERRGVPGARMLEDWGFRSACGRFASYAYRYPAGDSFVFFRAKITGGAAFRVHQELCWPRPASWGV